MIYLALAILACLIWFPLLDEERIRRQRLSSVLVRITVGTGCAAAFDDLSRELRSLSRAWSGK